MTINLTLAAALSAAPPLSVGGDSFVVFEHPVAPLVQPLVVNFEGSLCAKAKGGQQEKDGSWRLCADAGSFDVLRRLGVAVVHLENNHSADGGPGSRQAVASELAGHGMTALDGSWQIGQGARAFTLIAWHDAGDSLKAVTHRLHQTKVGRAVVLVHWSKTAALSEQRQIARQLVEAGAAVVIASGSHRLGPIERIGEAVVYYDIGDLVFDCDCSRSDVGLVVTLHPDRLPTAIVIRVAHQAGDRIGEPATDAAGLVGALVRRSAQLGTDLTWVDGRLEVLPEVRSSTK